MKEKTQRNVAIMKKLETMNACQVAEIYGISRQRVKQIIYNSGGYNSNHWKYKQVPRNIYEKIVLAIMSREYPDTTIARMFNTSQSTIKLIRESLGLPRTEKPIGCPKCKTHKYAKGLCKNCYMRNLRRMKNDS